MNTKIVAILNNNDYKCGYTNKKLDSELIAKLLKVRNVSPVNVLIYKNEHSNLVYFANDQGRKFSFKDGTRGFYFNKFYNDFLKESVQVANNGI